MKLIAFRDIFGGIERKIQNEKKTNKMQFSTVSWSDAD